MKNPNTYIKEKPGIKTSILALQGKGATLEVPPEDTHTHLKKLVRTL